MGCFGRNVWMKVKCKVFLSMPWRHIGGTETLFHLFLTLTLDEGEQLTTRHGHFITRKDSRYILNMTVRGPQTWCGHFQGEKDFCCYQHSSPDYTDHTN
jgi:hypothetical protein